jgi:hypothetical protein
MHEAGIVKRNEANLVPLKFTQHEQERPSSVSLEKTSPIFIIFVAGVITTMLFLIFEILAHKIKQKNRHTSAPRYVPMADGTLLFR